MYFAVALLAAVCAVSSIAVAQTPGPAPFPVTNGPAPFPVTNGPAPFPVTNGPAPFPVTNGPAPFPVTNGPPPFPVTNGPAPFPVTNGPAPFPVTNGPPPFPVTNGRPPAPWTNGPPSPPMTRGQPPAPVTNGPPSPPMTRGQPPAPWTNGPPSPPMTRGQPPAPMTNGPPSPPMTRGQPPSPMTRGPPPSPWTNGPSGATGQRPTRGVGEPDIEATVALGSGPVRDTTTRTVSRYDIGIKFEGDFADLLRNPTTFDSINASVTRGLNSLFQNTMRVVVTSLVSGSLVVKAELTPVGTGQSDAVSTGLDVASETERISQSLSSQNAGEHFSELATTYMSATGSDAPPLFVASASSAEAVTTNGAATPGTPQMMIAASEANPALVAGIAVAVSVAVMVAVFAVAAAVYSRWKANRVEPMPSMPKTESATEPTVHQEIIFDDVKKLENEVSETSV